MSSLLGRRALFAWVGAFVSLVGMAPAALGQDTGSEAVVTSEAPDIGQPGGDARIWVRTLDVEAGPRAALKVRYPDEIPADVPLVFDCEVISKSDNGNVVVALHVLDESEHPIHFASVHLRATEGLRECRFVWEQPELEDGEYRAHVDVIRTGSGFVLASAVLSVVQLTSATVFGDLATAQAGLESLLAHVDAQSMTLDAKPIVRGRLALAADTMKGLAPGETDWRRVHHVARFVQQQTDFARARMTFEEAPAGAANAAATVVSARGGAFVSNGKPVFLAGVYGAAVSEATVERLNRYGLNFVAIEESAAPPEQLGAFAQAAQANGVALAYLHDGGAPRYDEMPPAPAVDVVYTVENAVDASLRGLGPALVRLAPYENVVGVSLATAPRFMFSGDAVGDAFIAWLQQRYDDRTDLNRAWRTRFFNFDEVEPWWDLTRASYQYDWQTFHRSLGNAYFERMAATVRSEQPAVPVFATAAGEFFVPGETRYAIGRPELAELFPIQAFQYGGTRSDAKFARAYPAELVEIALRRSLDPLDPVIEFGDYRIIGDDIIDPELYAFVRSLTWDAAIDGVSAMALRGWGGAGAPAGLLDQVDALNGLITANAELNRLAEVIAAFQRAPATVGIVLSDSAKIYKDGGDHLTSVKQAYEGCSFSGLKVRLVSEAQLARGDLDGLRAIVLPNTPALRDEAFARLDALSETTMVFIRSGTTIPYDAWGRSRLDVIAFDVDALLAYEDTAAEYMHSMEAAIVSGKLPTAPRAVNAFGYTMEGVRARSVEHDGATYVYLMNLRETPEAVYLAGRFQSGFDVIRDRPMRFPAELEPLTPYLIRMDAPDPVDVALEAVEPGDAVEIPSARVRPYGVVAVEESDADGER